MANKKLQDMILFSSLPASTKERFLSTMTNEAQITALRVQEDQIVEQLSIIRKRYKFPSKSSVLALFDQGILRPVYDQSGTFILPTFLTAWLMSDRITTVKAVVNLTLYARKRPVTDKERGGDVDIDVKQLYGLMQNGLVAYLLYRYENRIINTMDVVKNAMQCYVRMILRCLDRLFALNSDKVATDRAAYIIGCFFLVNVLGKSDGIAVRGLAYQCCHNRTKQDIVEAVYDNLTPDYTDLTGLFSTLSAGVPALSSATLRGVLETWTRLYGDSTLLAMESFLHFAQMLSATYVGAQLNNELLINTVTQDYLKNFNVAFFQIAA